MVSDAHLTQPGKVAEQLKQETKSYEKEFIEHVMQRSGVKHSSQFSGQTIHLPATSDVLSAHTSHLSSSSQLIQYSKQGEHRPSSI